MEKYKRIVEDGRTKKKNWKAYHLWDKKTLTTDNKWYYGDSPSEIRKRLGTYDQRRKVLIPVGLDRTSEIKAYIKKSNIGKRNLKSKLRRKK